MKKPPNVVPQTIELETLASWSDFSERHLRALSDGAKLPPIHRGEIAFEAVPMLFRYLRRDSEELVREKLKKAIADRKIAEIDAEVAAGKFSSNAVFDQQCVTIGKVLNDGITAQEKPLQNALFAALPPIGEVDRDSITLAVQKALDAMRAKLADALEGQS
jgi:hypothetical protein